MKPRVVILSTADFDSPVWTNKQHLAVGLAREHDVVYIESLGLRSPTFSGSDLKRIFHKIRTTTKRRPKVSVKAKDQPSNLTLITPFIIPFHKYSIIRLINKKLLMLQTKKLHIDSSDSTLWTFSPLTYGLEEQFGSTIYHSVDLLHTLPRVPSSLLQKAERNLIETANHVVASSRGVEQHLKSAGASEVLLWENVAHVEIITAATGQERTNRAVFAGNLTPSKIDVSSLQSVLSAGIELAIAGPIDIDGAGSSSEISRLLEHPGVTYYGNLDMTDLANLLSSSKVGLIPYEINKYTRGVFPMKVYEYLAAGLDVISTPLPSLVHQVIEGLDLVDAGEFGSRASHLISNHNSIQVSKNIAAAEAHSWTGRINQASTLLENLRSK